MLGAPVNAELTTAADGSAFGPGEAGRAGPTGESAAVPYRRVLIVEDESTLRRVIARNLVSRGLLVREADCADAAVNAVAAERPDLLLLDINLPDRTGWEVLRELSQRRTEVPTIVMSAVRVQPARLAEFHPIAFLPKPFPLESLLRLVLEATPAQADSDA
jgi:DNA-binding response OmpR family regulator